MLGLAKRVGARFLLTSTSEVYGDPLEHPQKETYWGNVNPIGINPSLFIFIGNSLFYHMVCSLYIIPFSVHIFCDAFGVIFHHLTKHVSLMISITLDSSE